MLVLVTLSTAFGLAFQYAYNIIMVNTPNRVGAGRVGGSCHLSSSRTPLDADLWRPGRIRVAPPQSVILSRHIGTEESGRSRSEFPICGFEPSSQVPFLWEGHLQMAKRKGSRNEPWRFRFLPEPWSIKGLGPG